MKRRLTKAYDHMTMPDRCSHRIEAKLQEQLAQQETGQYTKIISPVPARRRGWAVGAAVVCLMLMLSVGGTMLFLYAAESMARQRKETAVSFAVTETVQMATPDEHYQVATSFSAETVESFAKVVRSNILEENWKALADKIQYPIEVEGKKVSDKTEFVDVMENIVIGSHFRLGMEYESCTGMLCDSDGIFMGGGLIQIQQTWQYQLKITAISQLTVESEDISLYAFMRSANGTVAIHQYQGYEEDVAFPNVSGNTFVREIGTGSPVIAYGDVVKTVYLQQTVTKVADYAFANCPALEEVYFEGDAPPQAEGVFDGSENVIVYYNTGTKGWGETWCGRKTQERVTENIYVGVASVQIDQQEANAAYLEVLTGKKHFWCDEFETDLTIEGYCEKRSKASGTVVNIPYFTLVDMDGNALKELILMVGLEDDGPEDYLILEYTDNSGGMVYCYMEPQRKMTDLRKDGSFYWRGNDRGAPGWMTLYSGDERLFVEDKSVTEKPPVQWHAYPCLQPEVVLQCYEYTGTGQNLFPSSLWFVFEDIAKGTMENNWARLKEDMSRWGMICLEEEGKVSVYDPDAPGCQMFGTLNEKNQFVSIGYYISNEYGEREAEVRDLLSDTPQYVAGSHLEDLDAHGREVERLEALLDYLS